MKQNYKYLMALLVLVVWGCQKTPDYVEQPYVCNCGSVTWSGGSYNLLASHQASADSTRLDYRRYHFSADVRLEGEEKSHSLSGWFELDDIGAGGQFVTNETIQEFQSQIYEYNLNGVDDTTRIFKPTSGSVSITKAAGAGATESVSFQLTLNEILDSTLSTNSVGCSGNFTITYRPPAE
ncbi:MAG: hypothetical protein ACKOW8_14725 [Flavobacteriales bacterium]